MRCMGAMAKRRPTARKEAACVPTKVWRDTHAMEHATWSLQSIHIAVKISEKLASHKINAYFCTPQEVCK